MRGSECAPSRVRRRSPGLAIEVGAPLDELGYADGTFRNERFGRGPVNDSVACVYGVFEM